MTINDNYVVYAVGNCDDGSHVLVIGITGEGVLAMVEQDSTLTVNLPPGLRDNITHCTLFVGETRNDLRKKFQDTGLPIEGFPV